MMRHPLTLAVAFSLSAGCTSSAPSFKPTAPPVKRGPEAAPPVLPLNPAHRWEQGDVNLYEVGVAVWDGAAFAPLAPPLIIVLPQKDRSATQARLENLRAGKRYQLTIVAKGNAGGTRPDVVLNAKTPSVLEFDFTKPQDLEDSLVRAVKTTLDPRPFSGNLAVVPGNYPPRTAAFDARVFDGTSGETRSAAAFQAGQSLVVSNLRVGIHYQVELVAKDSGGRTLQTAVSGDFFLDPTARDVEQNHWIPVRFD